MQILNTFYKYLTLLLTISCCSLLLCSCSNRAQNLATNMAAQEKVAAVIDYASGKYYVVSSPNLYDYVEIRIDEKDQDTMVAIANNKYSNNQLLDLIQQNNHSKLVCNAAILQLTSNYFNNGKIAEGKKILNYFNFPTSLRIQRQFYTRLNNPFPLTN